MPNAPVPKPVVLTILDGFGENPHAEHNAVAAAKTPTLDRLKAHYPHGLINASELYVGLPTGQMGNSEVGHMNIGSGRVLMQDLPRIDQAIADGSLAKNPALLDFIAALKKTGGTAHVMGLLSPGGVHSHQSHMAYLAQVIAKAGVKVAIHAFLDGRDTPPQSALEYLAQFEKELPECHSRAGGNLSQDPRLRGGDKGEVFFATVTGRYYAMDRDNRWERVATAYDVLTQGKGAKADSIEAAVKTSYAEKKTDEFVPATVIGNYNGMRDGDGVLMANFRADRAREITQALLAPAFAGFARIKQVKFAAALGMCEYSKPHNAWMQSLFPPQPLGNILGEILADKGLKQLRIAETEKYAHVTFFFNGGREEPFKGEERILVPSPKVATYDLQPEMSAYELTDRLVAAIEADIFDFIVVNYANCDMVGHSGNLEAATKAVEAVDTCLSRVWQAVEKKQGVMIITADHGNCEEMFDEDTHQPHTAHTLNLVPFIVATPALQDKKMVIETGKLADIAPTILKIMGLPQPAEMTGKPLL